MEQNQISASYILVQTHLSKNIHILVQTQDLLSLKINNFLVKIQPKRKKKRKIDRRDRKTYPKEERNKIHITFF